MEMNNTDGSTYVQLSSILNKWRREDFHPGGGRTLELMRALAYMKGQIDNEPRDPRIVLRKIEATRR